MLNCFVVLQLITFSDSFRGRGKKFIIMNFLLIERKSIVIIGYNNLSVETNTLFYSKQKKFNTAKQVQILKHLTPKAVVVKLVHS